MCAWAWHIFYKLNQHVQIILALQRNVASDTLLLIKSIFGKIKPEALKCIWGWKIRSMFWAKLHKSCNFSSHLLFLSLPEGEEDFWIRLRLFKGELLIDFNSGLIGPEENGLRLGQCFFCFRNERDLEKVGSTLIRIPRKLGFFS
jgi:hypothetical protein